ncbi:hypothetical protein KGM_203589 [Danaus plexippus plexippus]|uniref:Uncharacterized protein n=1 Tax=Danaus plexippus plexippus TaxID=278856 RepID=A0A212EKZ0_DANPL|nr:hypothetical protein KGM_203589 [Danaus plexippus plexippus]
MYRQHWALKWLLVDSRSRPGVTAETCDDSFRNSLHEPNCDEEDQLGADRVGRRHTGTRTAAGRRRGAGLVYDKRHTRGGEDWNKLQELQLATDYELLLIQILTYIDAPLSSSGSDLCTHSVAVFPPDDEGLVSKCELTTSL